MKLKSIIFLFTAMFLLCQTGKGEITHWNSTIFSKKSNIPKENNGRVSMIEFGKAKMTRNPGVTVKCRGKKSTCWTGSTITWNGEDWIRIEVYDGDPPFVFYTHEWPQLVSTYQDPNTGEDVTEWFTPEVFEELP